MKCKICTSENRESFKGEILDKYLISYFYCNNCGFLQTENPYWLEEAYQKPINASDTGYLQRNIFLSKKLTVLLSILFKKDEKYLDFAGGYGILVRLMRDIGFDFYWKDKFAENIFAKGFEFETDKKYEAVTAFESFEHFRDPMNEIDRILKFSENIIFTTQLLPDPIPDPDEWWYYGASHEQRISFYSDETFRFIADKYDLNYMNLKSLQLLTKKKIPGYMSKILKLTRIGLHKLMQKKLVSRTWKDHLKVKSDD